ncbi:C1QL [Mytilus edulis]|uniref:C1QL n=1 Tax=Mytilus edulis TaxID=6550 RepID=A0A8S3S9X5_MYTED|nr:C1QL [Mytilus edulis]
MICKCSNLPGQIRQERLLLQQTGRESGVAFSAYLSASFGASTFGIKREMIYDKIECNVGNGYDNNTETFRAPIKGTYSFTWTTCTSGTDKGEIGVELLINNQVHGSIWADSETIGDEECSTWVIVHTLNSGDVVFTRSHSSGSLRGSVRSDRFMRTTFSGWVLF